MDPEYDIQHSTDFMNDNSPENDLIAFNTSNPFSSDINPSNFSSSALNANYSNRAKNLFTLILETFNTGTSFKNPKKEFINAFIIRAIKRVFRSIAKGQIPLKTCIAIDVRDNNEMIIWENLQRIFRYDIDFILKEMKPEVGPETDGKSKRKDKEAGYKSFNNAFCKSFFSKEQMRKALSEIISLFYCNFSAKRCCERFNFYCCKERDNHNDECDEKWARLRDYFSINYFKDLDIDVNQDSEILRDENAIQSYQTDIHQDFQSDLNLDEIP